MNFLQNILALSFVALFALTAPLHAEELKITSEDGEVLASFDVNSFEALGLEEFKTKTPWTDGTITFDGVSLTKVLAEADVQGKDIIGHALDDYSASLSAEIIESFDPIIATRMNGVPMTVGDKGPFWIMFNFDDMPTNSTIELRSLAIWHLNELEVE